MSNYDTLENEGRSIRSTGSDEEVFCGVCETKMDVQRGIVGPISWAGAMAHRTVEHDLYTCPYLKNRWHEQALALIHLIQQTPSKTISELVDAELKEVLENKETTKRVWKQVF